MKYKDKYRINTPNGIDEKTFVNINGQEQYVFIRGKDINNPVILNLHGGPANPDACFTYEFVKEIVDNYTFVSWDQRGCGRTYFKNKVTDPDNKTATFEQAIEDVNELVNYLCGRFNKEKVIIMGHSYGTILGVNYIHKHPEKVEKYIGIGQSVSIMDTQTKNYEDIIKKIADDNKKTDKLKIVFNELKSNFSIENLTRFQRMYLTHFLSENKDIKQVNQLKLIINSPDLSWRDCRWLLGMSNRKKHFALNSQLMTYTLSSNIYDAGIIFSVPMFFISGEYDKHCNANLVKEYCAKITAPLKEIVIMKNHGHSPHIVEPAEFAKEVKRLLQC